MAGLLADCHKLFGLNLVHLGREDLASDYFEAAARLNPRDHIAVGSSRAQSNHAAARLNPRDHIAWYNLGLHQLNAKRARQSLTSLLKVVTLDPNYVKGYYVLGLVYEQLSDYEAALATYRRATEIQDLRNVHSYIC